MHDFDWMSRFQSESVVLGVSSHDHAMPGLLHEDTLALADAIEADVDPRQKLIRMRDNLSWAHVFKKKSKYSSPLMSNNNIFLLTARSLCSDCRMPFQAQAVGHSPRTRRQ